MKRKGSQSLSGWDGVFHYDEHDRVVATFYLGRNPFQGGMGFFTFVPRMRPQGRGVVPSQSLSGWDGVFHIMAPCILAT